MQEQLSQYILDRVALSDEQLTTILSYFHELTPKKNEILLGEGEASRKMFFVIKGCLRIYFMQENGLEATRYLAFENNFATALTAFITQEPSLEYIQALENTTLLYITRNDFYYLLELIPGWEKFYRSYLEKAYVINTNRLMSFITMDAITRYRLLLQENPATVQRLSNKLVASYLNISQEALSRLKSKI